MPWSELVRSSRVTSPIARSWRATRPARSESCPPNRSSECARASNASPEHRQVSKTILITNIGLLHRSGTEVVVEQLADGLRRRGHRPILFAPYLGPLAESMRERGFLVI